MSRNHPKSSVNLPNQHKKEFWSKKATKTHILFAFSQKKSKRASKKPQNYKFGFKKAKLAILFQRTVHVMAAILTLCPLRMWMLGRKTAKQTRERRLVSVCGSRTETMQNNKNISNSLAAVIHKNNCNVGGNIVKVVHPCHRPNQSTCQSRVKSRNNSFRHLRNELLHFFKLLNVHYEIKIAAYKTLKK